MPRVPRVPHPRPARALRLFRNYQDRSLRWYNRKTACRQTSGYLESGGDLLSRAVTSQVPSALKGLTSVFGMGTGGTPSPLPPETVSLLGAEVRSSL